MDIPGRQSSKILAEYYRRHSLRVYVCVCVCAYMYVFLCAHVAFFSIVATEMIFF